MDNITNFIIIDDAQFSTLICEIAVNNTFPGACIAKFDNPVEALLHLGTDYMSGVKKPTLLFLDIDMPVMSGWEFLSCFGSFDKKIKSQVKIIILSASTEEEHKQIAAENIYVTDYVVKPLLQEVLFVVLGKYKSAA